MTKKIVSVFTDGACLGNPGSGGYAGLIKFVDKQGKEHIKEIKGSCENTTNNKMELQAVVSSLKALKEPCNVNITTDSKYVKDGMEKWIFNWVKNNWKTASNKPVKNLELWQELYALSKKHNLSWNWVKGHNGHEENEIVDKLASNEAKKLKEGLKWFLVKS